MTGETRRANPSSLFQRGSPRLRTSIILPFLIIAVALAALAWRSYQVSVQMERGVKTLAVQYLNYTAEITARRVDAEIRGELGAASENWQQTERTATPDFERLRDWVRTRPWIVSAIYIPDAELENSIFVRERPGGEGGEFLTQEFYTPTGAVKFSYDPASLAAMANHVVRQHPHLQTTTAPEAAELRQQSQIALIPTGARAGFIRSGGSLQVITPLAAPMERFAIRASIRTPYVGSGWQNYRVTTLLFACVSLLLVGFGAAIAFRGLAQESGAMQLRAALIANVSHELRTPLSMIRLGAETLKRSGKLSQKERDDLQDSILREVLHLSHLVENVLDVARLQKSAKGLVLSPVDPVDLVESLVLNYESWIMSKGFDVDLDIDPAIEEQSWDRESVSRALLNLIDNAMKYSASEKVLAVSLTQSDDFITISVRDQGVGIRSQDLQRIFEPYYRAEFSDTTTRRGAGLGLTLVQQIMASHGGRVSVESVAGEGSVFSLIFPRARPLPMKSGASLLNATEA